MTNARVPGMALVEMLFAVGILGGAMIATLAVVGFLGDATRYEAGQADPLIHTTGTLYDLDAELCDASASSPNFYVEQDPLKPPSITFDKLNGVDSQGQPVWGSKVNYHLESDTPIVPLSALYDSPTINVGRIVREETPLGATAPQVNIVEENVPCQFINKGAPAWGFDVTVDGCALTIRVSYLSQVDSSGNHSSTTNSIELNAPPRTYTSSKKSNNSGPGNTNTTTPIVATTASSKAQITTEKTFQGSVSIGSVISVCRLRNPQIVIPAQ